MPVDMPPNYAYVADSMTSEYVQSVELKHNTAGYTKGSEIILYSSSIPHLSETLLDRIHNNLDYVENISYQNAMLPYEGEIYGVIPKVEHKMENLDYRGAYKELVKESAESPIAKDVLFSVDNEILMGMQDFHQRLDVIKEQEQALATNRLKEAGILFDKDPVVEGIAHVGSKADFAVQPAINVQTLEEELTANNKNKELVLYRLPGDKGSMLRASVGSNLQEEQNYAVCRASELTTMYAYNKYAHDLIEATPAAKEFFMAQSVMEGISQNGKELGANTSFLIDHAMQEVSPTYAQYGHVSTNPLHRVEETVNALAKVLEDNKRNSEFVKHTFNQEMNSNGLGEQLTRDIQSAPDYYTKFTRKDEKELIGKLKKKINPQKDYVLYNKAIQQTVTMQRDAAAR